MMAPFPKYLSILLDIKQRDGGSHSASILNETPRNPHFAMKSNTLKSASYNILITKRKNHQQNNEALNKIPLQSREKQKTK
jgi:hypothetical protein